MIKKFKTELILLIAFVLIGQIVFGLFSKSFTRTYYESRVFATTGIRFDSVDLHKLNEGAHYFGQTMIGWTKFPNFRADLIKFAGLPEDAALNMHMQERQNIVLTLTTKSPIDEKQLKAAKNFLQTKLDEYNKNTNTKFILTNVDYDQSEIRRSYALGASFAFILSLFLAFGVLFLKKELFPPRLKL